MNSKSATIVLALVLSSLPATLAARPALEGPTEVRYWDGATAFNGYTLFGAGGTSYLIDVVTAIS